jgi:hypothetical protein
MEVLGQPLIASLGYQDLFNMLSCLPVAIAVISHTSLIV